MGDIFKGDNLPLVKMLIDGDESLGIAPLAGKVQLIYIDPPFYSGSDYVSSKKAGEQGLTLKQTAYPDRWNGDMYEYLTMLTVRILAMKELLSETGSLWLHLDWHAVHYAKVLLDEIFGPENFINEIIWNYKSGGSTKRHFSRKHDTLLFYAKSKNYYFNPIKEKSYNRGLKPYHFKGVEEFCDENGWYTMVNMKDVWPIDMVGRTSSERTGYATQKPEALLRRIIESCTRPNDMVADFFGGSGTLAAVAADTGRTFIHADAGDLSIAGTMKRLMASGHRFRYFEAKDGSGKISEDAPKAILKKDAKTGDIVLESYKIPHIENLPLDQKSIENAKKLEETNPLGLVDFWAVDYNYNDMVFQPQRIMTGNCGKIQSICESDPKAENPAVLTADVFGMIQITQNFIE